MFRAQGALLRIEPRSIAHVTTIFNAKRIIVRPVHQPAQIIPLIHTTYEHPVAHTERNAFRQIEVMSDQQRAVTADIDNEALMPGAVVVIGQEALHEASDFDPASVIAFL